MRLKHFTSHTDIPEAPQAIGEGLGSAALEGVDAVGNAAVEAIGNLAKKSVEVAGKALSAGIAAITGINTGERAIAQREAAKNPENEREPERVIVQAPQIKPPAVVVAKAREMVMEHSHKIGEMENIPVASVGDLKPMDPNHESKLFIAARLELQKQEGFSRGLPT